jgi:hypothetical protein
VFEYLQDLLRTYSEKLDVMVYIGLTCVLKCEEHGLFAMNFAVMDCSYLGQNS